MEGPERTQAPSVAPPPGPRGALWAAPEWAISRQGRRPGRAACKGRTPKPGESNMKYRFARPLWAALCLAACATGVAATDLIPTADFARRIPLTMPRLSPDGKHFSVVYNDPDGKTHAVAIYAVEDPTKPVSLIRMPPYELPADII